jgi:histidinol-phosphate/aromatic aminotransferase/cobyric acid decarboxylase-like protein
MSSSLLAHHGDDEVGPGLSDFAVNVAVRTPPGWLRTALTDALTDVAAYPNPRAAVEAVAAVHRCDPASVLMTNGAAEAFTLVARARRWDAPTVVHPQFTEPESALRALGYVPTAATLLRSNGFQLQPAVVPADADLVVMGNPTNPTSRLHSRDDIRALLRPGRVVVVDEAFMDLTPGEEESLAQEAPVTPGLVVIRSLTKTYGLAGVRAGYVLAAPEQIRRLAAHQPHWSVNTLALVAATTCLGPDGERHRARVADELAGNISHLAAALRGAGLDPVPDPAAPFVLARHPWAALLRERLRNSGYAVRRGDTFPGLGPEWIRVAAREPAAVDGLVKAMRQELGLLGRGR